jgi:sugar O-acyltransferase (sialic acid O-acetyltransferase NeuD family)
MSKPNSISEVIIYGGTGQAKVVRPILESQHYKIIAVADDTPDIEPPFKDITFLNGYENLLRWTADLDKAKIGFVLAIGNPHGETRLKLQKKLEEIGLTSIPVIHESTIMYDDCEIGQGAQIMPGAIIMPGCKIGMQCIINTKASLDHGSLLGDGCELAPGSTICGEVIIEDFVWIGAGATILPRVIVHRGSIVGAGAMVNRDVPPFTIVAGVPAKILKEI